MELVGIMPEDLTKGIAGIPLGFSNGGIYQDPTPLTKKMTYGPDTVHDDPDPTSDAFSDPDTYEQANPVALGIMSALTGGATGLLSGPSLLTKGVGLYNTISNFFSGKEPEPDPVPFGELGNISDAISQAQAQEAAQNPFGQTQVSLAAAQGAESELGNPPPGPPGFLDPFSGTLGANTPPGAPPSAPTGGDGAAAGGVSGDPGAGVGEDSEAVGDPDSDSGDDDEGSGDPGGGGSGDEGGADGSGNGGPDADYALGGFVNTGFQMGGIASLLTGANALQNYASSKLNLSNGIGGYGPVLGSFG